MIIKLQQLIQSFIPDYYLPNLERIGVVRV
jgi:hypothetical protein